MGVAGSCRARERGRLAHLCERALRRRLRVSLLFRNRDPAPDNGDGQAFRTTGGDATLRVFGFLNVDHATSAAMLSERTQGKVAFPNRMARNDRFAFSGTQGDTDVYLRCNLGSDDVVGCVEVTYPTRDRHVDAPRNADEWLAAGQISVA